MDMKHQAIIRMRATGKSLSAVGEAFGMTRQGVDQVWRRYATDADRAELAAAPPIRTPPKPRPPKLDAMDTRIFINIRSSEKAALAALCSARDTTPSALIRSLITKELAQ